MGGAPRHLDAIVKEHRQRDEATLKNIDTDVEQLLDWLRTIGTDYATATAPSDDNLLGLDLSQWGGDRCAPNCPRTVGPAGVSTRFDGI